MITFDKGDPKLVKFWKKMSVELFNNVDQLYEQIETQYTERTGDDGMGGQMAVSGAITNCSLVGFY